MRVGRGRFGEAWIASARTEGLDSPMSKRLRVALAVISALIILSMVAPALGDFF